MNTDEYIYRTLREILRKPAPWEACTTDILWTDPHISKSMLALPP